MSDGALIQNDAVVVGLLAATLGLVFWTTESTHPFFRRFYRYVPALVLCYIVPALYNTFGLVDGAASQVYPVVSRYVLRRPWRCSRSPPTCRESCDWVRS